MSVDENRYTTGDGRVTFDEKGFTLHAGDDGTEYENFMKLKADVDKGGLKIEGSGKTKMPFEYRSAWLNHNKHFEHDNVWQLIAKIWGFDFFVFTHVPVFKTMFLLHLIIAWLMK